MLRLDFGCGYRKHPGFIGVDLNPACADDGYVLDVSGPLPFGSGTVDEIRAVDVLEHIPYRATAATLTEWSRVLMPGGRLYVQVPDAGLIMRRYAMNPTAMIERIPPDLPQTALAGATWRLLGGQDDGRFAHPDDDWRLNAHFALFDEHGIVAALIAAGLTVDSIESNFHPNLLVWSTKP